MKNKDLKDSQKYYQEYSKLIFNKPFVGFINSIELIVRRLTIAERKVKK